MSEFAQVEGCLGEIHPNRPGIGEGIGQFLPGADRDSLVARLPDVLDVGIEAERGIN